MRVPLGHPLPYTEPEKRKRTQTESTHTGDKATNTNWIPYLLGDRGKEKGCPTYAEAGEKKWVPFPLERKVNERKNGRSLVTPYIEGKSRKGVAGAWLHPASRG